MVEKFSLVEWESQGIDLFGREKRSWNFQCPKCFRVQSVEEILKEGYPPNIAYSYCKSCHFNAEDGTYGKGKLIRLNRDKNVEIFNFAMQREKA